MQAKAIRLCCVRFLSLVSQTRTPKQISCHSSRSCRCEVLLWSNEIARDWYGVVNDILTKMSITVKTLFC